MDHRLVAVFPIDTTEGITKIDRSSGDPVEQFFDAIGTILISIDLLSILRPQSHSRFSTFSL